MTTLAEFINNMSLLSTGTVGEKINAAKLTLDSNEIGQGVINPDAGITAGSVGSIGGVSVESLSPDGGITADSITPASGITETTVTPVGGITPV